MQYERHLVQLIKVWSDKIEGTMSNLKEERDNL